MDWTLPWTNPLSIFLFFSKIMSRIIRVCPGVGDRKCGAFLSSVDRDPHPTCSRCRGKVCTMDITCDICADWSVAQWEQFVKKRAYKDRKKTSRPSGSVPPAPLPSPRTETSSGVSRPGTSSSSRPSGGQGKQGGSQGAPGVVSRGAPSLPLDLGPARGVGVPLGSRLVRAGTLPLLLLHFPCLCLGCLSPFLTARSTT